MKSKIFSVFGILALVMAFAACNRPGFRIQRVSHPTMNEVKVSGSFSSVINQTFCDIKLSQVPGQYGIKVKAPKEVARGLKFHIEDDMLIIGMDKAVFGDFDVEIYISAPDYKNIISQGSGDIEFNTLRTEAVNIVSAGSGDVDGENVFAESITLLQQGSGDIDMSQISFKTLSVTLQGSGDAELEGLDGVDLTCVSQGSGDIKVSGKVESAVLNTAGSGDILKSTLMCPNIKAESKGSGDIY